MKGFDEKTANYLNSQVDLESIDDKSRVTVFVKHNKSVNLKATLQKNQVVLIKSALRKVKNDLY